MSIDLSQFHQVFFEESFEGLDVMESGLLELDTANIDDETINTIFRGAHSIKGGSATFGFNVVAEFTHVIETLLDEVRAGTRSISREEVDLFLQSVDCLRDLLQGLQNKEEVDETQASELRIQFEAILGSESGDAADQKTSNETNTGWLVKFKPESHILRTGNEPLRMFWQLEALGKVRVTSITDEMPSFAGMNVELCYFSWEIEVTGNNIPKESVSEVFEWIEDEAEIVLTSLGNDSADQDSTESEALKPAVQKIETQAPKKADKQPKPVARNAKESGSIRVDIDKIDTMINMVGELVITQSMLGQIGEEFTFDKLSKLQEGLQDLERNVAILHESVMRIRMLPISFTISRFPRMVRDLSRQLDKKIELVLKGENTELDKTVMEKIGDPLVHLLRNSLDHGIELPELRRKAGKPETGTINLEAFHQGGNVVIKISDDGAGLNKEKIRAKAIENGVIRENETLTQDQINDLIFQPGFSTAEVVTDVSGRGVGMDVVRRNIQSLGGTVSVKSEPGVGSTFTITLPLTLAILDGQLVRVGKEIYIFPLVSIVESLSAGENQVNKVVGASDVLKLRDEFIPIIPLYETFGIEPDSRHLKDSLIVVVESEKMKVGLMVDELLAQQQVVIKSLESNYQSVGGISGATILGDGTISLILDIPGVVKLAEKYLNYAGVAA